MLWMVSLLLFLESVEYKVLEDIKSIPYSELSSILHQLSFPEYKSRQIFKWLAKGVDSFEEMTDINKTHRQILNEHFYISNVSIKQRKISKDFTVKYLFSLQDGQLIEAVLMKYHHGYSMCISTQVGCKMGCAFCATGKEGFVRNLSAGEILSQIHLAQKDMKVRISNIVMMGMGEPLDNYDNVLKFISIVTSAQGMNLSTRHITLSTCGVVDKIYKLADENLAITLSVSLHACDNKLRNEMMPINCRYPIEGLLEACKYYIEKTKRRVTFEYALIKGKNASKEDAIKLSRLISGVLCHVNLIPVNEIEKSDYQKPSLNDINQFKELLEKQHITATVRRTLGNDIDASCGQLRAKIMKESK